MSHVEPLAPAPSQEHDHHNLSGTTSAGRISSSEFLRSWPGADCVDHSATPASGSMPAPTYLFGHPAPAHAGAVAAPHQRHVPPPPGRPNIGTAMPQYVADAGDLSHGMVEEEVLAFIRDLGGRPGAARGFAHVPEDMRPEPAASVRGKRRHTDHSMEDDDAAAAPASADTASHRTKAPRTSRATDDSILRTRFEEAKAHHAQLVAECQRRLGELGTMPSPVLQNAMTKLKLIDDRPPQDKDAVLSKISSNTENKITTAFNQLGLSPATTADFSLHCATMLKAINDSVRDANITLVRDVFDSIATHLTLSPVTKEALLGKMLEIRKRVQNSLNVRHCRAKDDTIDKETFDALVHKIIILQGFIVTSQVRPDWFA